MPASRDTMGTDGTASSTRRLSAAISPWMLPPRSTSMTGKLPRVEHVAGDHDVRSPEEREDVAVGVRRWLVQHLDRLAVQVQVLPRVVKRSRSATRRARRVESDATVMCRSDAFGREDGRHRSRGVRPPPGGACAWKELFAGLREHFVAANMVGIGPGVDDVANGLRRDAS